MSISDLENGFAEAKPDGRTLAADSDTGTFICKQVAIPNLAPIITPVIAEALRSGLYEHTEAIMLDRVIEPGDRVLLYNPNVPTAGDTPSDAGEAEGGESEGGSGGGAATPTAGGSSRRGRKGA